MASLRLALKASLEASESQPAPPKRKSTPSVPAPRNRDISEQSQNSRKRSHSEASTGSVGDEQKAARKKTSTSREGVKEKESKTATKDRKAAPSTSVSTSTSAPPSTSNSRRDITPSSSSSEVTRPAIGEARERSTPTRKAAATANKQFSSPSSPCAPPGVTSSAITTPILPTSDKKGGTDKKPEVNNEVSGTKEKTQQGGSVARALEDGVKGGNNEDVDSNVKASKRDNKAPLFKSNKPAATANDEKKSAPSARSTAKDLADSTKSDDSKHDRRKPNNVMPNDVTGLKEKKVGDNDHMVSSPVKDLPDTDFSVPHATSIDDVVEEVAEKEKPASLLKVEDNDSLKKEIKDNDTAGDMTDALSSGPPATGLSIAMTEELRGMEGGSDSGKIPAARSDEAGSNNGVKDGQAGDGTTKGKSKKNLKDAEKPAGDKESLVSGSASPGGEPKNGKKRSAAALTENEADTTGEGKVEDRAKQEERSDVKVGKDGYQSPRAAAQVAKSRLSLSGTNKTIKTAAKSETDDNGGDPSSKSAPSSSKKSVTPREQKSARKKDKAFVAPAHWVACDSCGKWRSLPGDLDISALPEQWYCSMNKWDNAHNDCSKEEEEYIDPAAPAASMTTSRSTGSLSALDGEGGKKKDRSSRGESKIGSRKRTSRADGDGSDDEGTNRNRVSTSRRRSKGSARGGGGDGDVADSMTDMVSWVQCNKCSKWRKVPSSIGSDLPDVWYCSMNTWSPEYSKCSAKEEEDERVVVDDKVKERKSSAAAARGKNFRGSNRKGEPEPSVHSVALAPGKTVVKKIQWVQCERKNCKKWRKIPIEVDLSKLPDQWFCEMNQWDPERAACDLAEDSDDEGDQPANHAARTQLILGNSKGPGTLSYRRLIFGADGRIRPFYSEKNKNGYGLFSFTEVFRPSESDEYIMPTRRIGYWSSSSFDGSAKPRVQAPVKKKKVDEEEVVPREVEFQTACSTLRPDHATYLIDTIQRLTPNRKSLPPPPSPFLKAHPKQQKCTLFRRLQVACSVVQNYLLLFAGNPQPQTLEEVFYGISTILFFHDPELEQCRAAMGKGELLDALHRLDQAGTVEATYDNDGDLSFRLLLQRSTEQNIPIAANPIPALLASCEPTPLAGKAVPLKMRKRKIGLQSFPNLNATPPPSTTVMSSRANAVPPAAPSLPSSSSATKLPDTFRTTPPSDVKTEATTEVVNILEDNKKGDEAIKMEVDDDAV